LRGILTVLRLEESVLPGELLVTFVGTKVTLRNAVNCTVKRWVAQKEAGCEKGLEKMINLCG
jgi:hypothetical protein